MHAVHSAISPPTEKKTDEHVLPLVILLICIATMPICVRPKDPNENPTCVPGCLSHFLFGHGVVKSIVCFLVRTIAKFQLWVECRVVLAIGRQRCLSQHGRRCG